MRHIYILNNKKEVEVSEQLWFDLLNSFRDYFSQVRVNDPVEFMEFHRYAFLDGGVPTVTHIIKCDESVFRDMYLFRLTQENEALGL